MDEVTLEIALLKRRVQELTEDVRALKLHPIYTGSTQPVYRGPACQDYDTDRPRGIL